MDKSKLTNREEQIVELFKSGQTHEQIGEALKPRMCARMVQSHLSNAARKFGFTNRPQLEKFLRQGTAKAKP